MTEHQGFQEAVIAFNTWLSMTREKLATCSDTYGDKPTVESKVQEAKVSILLLKHPSVAMIFFYNPQILEQDLSEGADLLAAAKMSAQKLLLNTAKAGHARINHDLQTLSQDFTDVGHQVETASNNLQSCLQCWNDFEIAQDRFTLWLNDTSIALKKELELKANLPEKEQALSQQQVWF